MTDVLQTIEPRTGSVGTVASEAPTVSPPLRNLPDVPKERSALPTVRMQQSFTQVIFGATGDLTARKIIPAIFRLWHERFLPAPFAIIGVGRCDKDDIRFRAELESSLKMQSSLPDGGGEQSAAFVPSLTAAWEFITPILKAWQRQLPTHFPNYAAGSWGSEADELFASCPRTWREPFTPSGDRADSKGSQAGEVCET